MNDCPSAVATRVDNDGDDDVDSTAVEVKKEKERNGFHLRKNMRKTKEINEDKLRCCDTFQFVFVCVCVGKQRVDRGRVGVYRQNYLKFGIEGEKRKLVKR